MRKYGKIDISQEALDDKVVALYGLAAVELPGLVISNLADFGNLGAARGDSARRIFERHKDDLLNPDGHAMSIANEELARAIEHSLDGVSRRDRTTIAFLGALYDRTDVIEHMLDFSRGIVNVYESLGYPPHPILAALAEVMRLPGEEIAQPFAPGRLPVERPEHQAGTVEDAPSSDEAPEVPDDGQPQTAPEETYDEAERIAEATVKPSELAIAGLAEQTPSAQAERQIIAQLDEIILPTEDGGLGDEEFESRLRSLADAISREHRESADATVVWERLNDLSVICREYGGRLFKSKRGSLGSAPPYFVCTFEYNGNTYAVAESPVYGNATYFISERHAPGTWLEVLTLSRRDARDVGAVRIRHSKQSPHGERHRQKIRDLVTEFSLT